MSKQRRGKQTRVKLIGGDLTFSVQDSQFVEWQLPLDHFSDASKDFSPVFETFSQYRRRSIERNFEAQGRPEPWAALKPATIRARERAGYGAGPILTRSGHMRRRFHFVWGPRSYREINRVHYFPHHQFGAPRANIPARPMIVLLVQDKQEFTRQSRRHLMPGGR